MMKIGISSALHLSQKCQLIETHIMLKDCLNISQNIGSTGIIRINDYLCRYPLMWNLLFAIVFLVICDTASKSIKITCIYNSYQ